MSLQARSSLSLSEERAARSMVPEHVVQEIGTPKAPLVVASSDSDLGGCDVSFDIPRSERLLIILLSPSG